MSKKIEYIKKYVTGGSGLWIDEPNGRINSAFYLDPDESNPSGRWAISHHPGRMPADSTDYYESEEELLAAMEELALVEYWRIQED